LLPIEVSTESFGAAGRFPCGKGTKRVDHKPLRGRSVPRVCGLKAFDGRCALRRPIRAAGTLHAALEAALEASAKPAP